jgi:crotonobetainyl-CoA:carnitine CoA-transferase CaiB-like acyl-CoA transferase
MTLPLDDLDVLELAEAAAGPLTTMLFADFGAEVVKVERPGTGDILRQYEPKQDGVAGYFLWANRNKRGIAVDMSTDEGREIVLDLAAKADVVLENYRPGVVDDLGVGYDDVREVNEDVIYCHVSGFGQSGPYRDRKAIDHSIQGEAGVMSVTGFPERPAKAGFVYTDITTALYNAFALLSAVEYRRKTGEGQEMDMPMWDVQVLNLGLHGYRYLMNDEVSDRMGTKYPAVVPYQAFETADGDWVNVCAITPRHWEEYCERVIDRPDLLDHPKYETNQLRIEHRDDLEPILEAEMRQLTRAEAMERLWETGIPSSPVNAVDEVIEHPQTDHRDLITTADHAQLGEIDMIGFPGQMDAIDQEMRRAPPVHGEHTEPVLEELGYSDAEIEAFLGEGVVEGYDE